MAAPTPSSGPRTSRDAEPGAPGPEPTSGADGGTGSTAAGGGASPVPEGHARRPGHTQSDVVRAVVLAVAAVAQVLGSPLGTALAGGRSVADVSDAYANVVTPAGYAFAIWGLIFALCLAYAVYQALPAQLGRAVHRRAGWPLAVAFAANTAWELVFPQDGRWVLVANVLILVVVASTAVALARLQVPEPSGLDRVLPTVTASLLLGWVTIATVANVAITGVYLGAPTDTALATGAGIVALVAAAVVVLDVSMRLRVAAGPFAAAAAWGVYAVSRNDPPTPVELAAYFALVVIAVGLLAQSWRTRRPLRVLLA